MFIYCLSLLMFFPTTAFLDLSEAQAESNSSKTFYCSLAWSGYVFFLERILINFHPQRAQNLEGSKEAVVNLILFGDGFLTLLMGL